jgi:hypothetical protein
LEDPHTSDDFYPGNSTIEEESEEEDGTIKSSKSKSPTKQKAKREVEDAERELRRHELMALLSCFVSPVVGAWLLHAIRGQLSRPSEGLVSNYNLTIFLLGAELRPMSHLIKMVQSRTLHLQRVVNNNPFEEDKLDHDKMSDLSKRLDELESHIAEKASSNATNGNASASTTGQVSTAVRKDLQPELDALNRAVRRYEKRATLLTMQTEARLQDLEARMADAITLAAAAERNGLNKQRGSAAILFDFACASVVVPVQIGWSLLSMPARIAGKALEAIEGYFGRTVRTELKTAGKMGKTGQRPAGRGSKKPLWERLIQCTVLKEHTTVVVTPQGDEGLPIWDLSGSTFENGAWIMRPMPTGYEEGVQIPQDYDNVRGMKKALKNSWTDKVNAAIGRRESWLAGAARHSCKLVAETM